MARARRRTRTVEKRWRGGTAPGNQPRPAFGLRPWFAFERRARSLRRFALAMRGASVPGAGARFVVAAADGVWHAPVRCATSPSDRFRGLRPSVGATGMVFRARSIHTFGMATDLLVVALDAGGRVLSAEVVAPRAVRVVPGAKWIIELAPWGPAPEVGTGLVVLRRILAR